MATNLETAAEAVNGKIDLGVRKLISAYVENATTIYAYFENEFQTLEKYQGKINEVVAGSEKAETTKEGEMYLIYSDKDECFARGRIEQTKAGPGGFKVRARLVDIGRGDLFDAAKVRELPEAVGENHLPIICTRYKMADLKAKGRNEGFSAYDREAGAEWLRALISKFGPVVKAKCHQIVNYKGGIMFDGEIGGKNINQLALMQGLAVPNPALMAKQPQPQFMLPQAGFGPMRPQMNHHHREWDADYLEYGGNRNAHHQGGQQGFNQPGRPLRRPMTNNGPQAGPNGGYLPVPGGYNPYKINEPQNNKKNNSNNNKKPDGDVQKLKATLQTLEASLAKKNKEIADLKKAKDEENNMQALAETVARVQALRLNQNKKDDQNIREKVSDSARLVRDVHNSLTLLGKKSSDADKAVLMLNQCQEQMATLEDSQPLEVTLEGAKQAVAKYAGSYILEFNELRSNLDDGCEVLQQVLSNDVPGPQVKLNVGQLETQKRKEVVEVAAQMADQWAKEDKKESSRNKSDETLTNLIHGLNEAALCLTGAAKGQGLPQRSLPNVVLLLKKATNGYNQELGLLSPPGSVAAESSTNVGGGGMNYASVMATLAKAITICLAEKAVAEEKYQKYAEVTASKNY